MTAPKPRGFALLTPEARREMARLGGSSVPADRRTFSTDRSLASAAGRKGGLVGRKTEAAE